MVRRTRRRPCARVPGLRQGVHLLSPALVIFGRLAGSIDLDVIVRVEATVVGDARPVKPVVILAVERLPRPPAPYPVADA